MFGGSNSAGAWYWMSTGSGVGVDAAGFETVGDGGAEVSVACAVASGLSLARCVGGGSCVACRLGVGVAVTTTVTSAGVDSTLAALSVPGVAVTTMIHGVWVGGGSVGSGVLPHPAAMLAIMISRAGNARNFLMV